MMWEAEGRDELQSSLRSSNLRSQPEWTSLTEINADGARLVLLQCIMVLWGICEGRDSIERYIRSFIYSFTM